MRDYTSKQHSHQDRSARAGEGAGVAGSEAGGKRAFGMRRSFPLGPRSCPREHTPIPGETPIRGADTHPGRCGDPAAAPYPVPVLTFLSPRAGERGAVGCWPRSGVPGRGRAGRGGERSPSLSSGAAAPAPPPGSGPAALLSRAAGLQRCSPRTNFGGDGGLHTPGGRHWRGGPAAGEGLGRGAEPAPPAGLRARARLRAARSACAGCPSLGKKQRCQPQAGIWRKRES